MTATKHKMSVPVPEADGTETVYEIEYTYSPGRPMVMYLMNGDPGYPEEPAEVEIVSCVPEADDDRSLILHRYVEDHHEDDEDVDGQYEDYMEQKRLDAEERKHEKDVGAARNSSEDGSD